MNDLKKHGFWIACGLLTLAMIGTWWWASGNARSTQMANEQMIETAAKNTMDIKKKTFAESPADVVVHPTPGSQAGMKKRIDLSTRKMLEAWELRRNAQEPILKWPEKVLVRSEFTQRFSKYDPPQKFALRGPDSNELIPPYQDLMLIYKELIPQRMDELASIISTDWQPIETMATAARKDKDKGKNIPSDYKTGMENLDFIVKWDAANRNLWKEKLTIFQGMDGNQNASGVPLPRQVFALQEDLWLLEAFFNIVKSINGDAQTNAMAPIKEIVHVAFGRESYQTEIGKLSTPDPKLLTGRLVSTSASSDGDEGPARNRPPSREDRDEDPNPSAGASSAKTSFEFNLNGEQALLGPFHGRYANINFDPLAIDEILGIFANPILPDRNVETIVARRIPFRIAVTMSESKVPDLIAGFSNSDFAFEVFQVRINREDAYNKIERGGKNTAKNTGERDRPSVGVGSGGAGASGVDTGGGNANAGASGTEKTVDKANVEVRTKDDVSVEFYGIVKIYNPVDWGRFKDMLDQSDAALTTASRNP